MEKSPLLPLRSPAPFQVQYPSRSTSSSYTRWIFGFLSISIVLLLSLLYTFHPSSYDCSSNIASPSPNPLHVSLSHPHTAHLIAPSAAPSSRLASASSTFRPHSHDFARTAHGARSLPTPLTTRVFVFIFRRPHLTHLNPFRNLRIHLFRLGHPISVPAPLSTTPNSTSTPVLIRAPGTHRLSKRSALAYPNPEAKGGKELSSMEQAAQKQEKKLEKQAKHDASEAKCRAQTGKGCCHGPFCFLTKMFKSVKKAVGV